METVITSSVSCVYVWIKSKNNHTNLLYIKSSFEVHLLFGLKLYLFLSFELVPHKQKRIWTTKVNLQFWTVSRFWSRCPFPWHCYMWKLFNENHQSIWWKELDTVTLYIYVMFWCLQNTVTSTAFTFYHNTVRQKWGCSLSVWGNWWAESSGWPRSW